MDVLTLTGIILKEGGDRYKAAALAWRILNEYPEDFRAAALQLAKGEMPEICVEQRITVPAVMEISGAGKFDALELLRIISVDSKAGRDLLFRLGAHDRVMR